MLGLRGVRLGIVQGRPLPDAGAGARRGGACARQGHGGDPSVEIMIPLVSPGRARPHPAVGARRRSPRCSAERDARLDVAIGTMIETPRAALRADEIAEAADFFSFGTNDLTQMTFGFSRDDVGPILERYLERVCCSVDPFESIDQTGVGELVRLGVERGRRTKPGLKIGVCGEHGGDPDVDRVLRVGRGRLRVVLAVPGAGRPARRGPAPCWASSAWRSAV